MSEIEKKILKMYDGSFPDEKTLFDVSYVNHWAWSLAVLFGALLVWFAIALVNAENQRYAMLNGQCQDPVFKGQVDVKCLDLVHSRDHWWQHLAYAVTHFQPEPVKR
ncbi:MAG: hypothetical protein ACLGI6_12260 [Gammaproteobacteria bacterium]